MANQQNKIDMTQIDQLLQALSGKQVLPGVLPEQAYLARNPSIPTVRRGELQMAPTQQQLPKAPAYNPIEEKAKREADAAKARQLIEQQQLAQKQAQEAAAAQAKIDNPNIVPVQPESSIAKSGRLSYGTIVPKQENILPEMRLQRLKQEMEAQTAQKQYEDLGKQLQEFAKSPYQYTPSPRTSTDEMQLALQKQLNELNLPPKEVDSMTEFLNTLAPVLLGGLVGGQAGTMAAAGGYQAGTKKLEDIRKAQSEERKAKLENLGKFSAGLGEIRKGEAEQAKAEWEIAKAKGDLQAKVTEKLFDEAAKNAQFRALRPEEQSKMINQMTKDVWSNQMKSVEEYLDAAIRERGIEAGVEKARVQKEDEGKKEKRDIFKDTMALRKEFQSREIVKQWNDIEGAFYKLKNITTGKGTGANDLAIIFSYMKLLDPRSVVREGEQERAIKTGGIPDRVWAYYQQVQNGQLLSPEVRLEFKNSAERLLQGHAKMLKEVEDEFSNIADSVGFDKKQVFTPKALKYLPKEKPAQQGQPQGMTYTPDVINYAQKHGISNEQALQIKIGRGGK